MNDREAFMLGVGLAALVIAVALVVTTPRTPEVVPSPPVSPTDYSSECTAADLDDGACLTWDDIREQPVYSEGGRP